MPYDYIADTSVNCVFFRHCGPMEAGDAIGSWDFALKDSNVSSGINVLRDITHSSLSDAYSDQKAIKQARERLQNVLGDFRGGRYAWVVKDAKDFALIHRWTVAMRFNISFEIKPFREMAKATEWLGLSAEYKVKYPKPVE